LHNGEINDLFSSSYDDENKSLIERSTGEERDVQNMWHVLERVEVYRGLCVKIE
jgi:hypothetical protein